MQRSEEGSVEQRQLQEKLWVFAQRGVVLLVALLAGVLIGYYRWGETVKLKQDVATLEERVSILQKDRDTLNSQKAIIDRDKKEVEKRLQDMQARCAAPAEAAPVAHP
ncbi:MAG: hypothetical protein U0587_11445 [Candidatus Binatia bacterium]